MDADVAGSGVTGDLLAHCIDTAMWLNGGIKDVSAVTETFVKERVHQLTGKVQKVVLMMPVFFIVILTMVPLGFLNLPVMRVGIKHYILLKLMVNMLLSVGICMI